MTGMFDDVFKSPLDREEPVPEGGRTPEGRTAITVEKVKPEYVPGEFDSALKDGSNVPKPPGPDDWMKTHEMRNQDPPSWTEWARQKGQDALIGAGMKPYDAGHFAKGAVEISKLNPYVSFAFGAGDLAHHAPRGEWIESIGDMFSMVPGTIAGARRLRGAAYPQTHMEPQLSNADMRQITRDSYAAVANSPVTFHPHGMDAALDRSLTLLGQPGQAGGFNRITAQGTFETVNDFRRMWAQRGTPVTGQDIEGLRQQLQNIKGGTDGEAARRMRDYIDAYRSAPPAGHVVSGTPQEVAQLRQGVSDARGNYRSRKTAEAVEAGIYNAGLNAAGQHSGKNMGNNVRQAVRSLIRVNPKTGQRPLFGAREDEIAALEAVNEGDAVTNWMRNMSNRLGAGGGIGQTAVGALGGHAVRSGLSSAATGGGAHFMGLDPVTSAGLAVAGAGVPMAAGQMLRGAANNRSVQAARDAIDLIRRNSPAYQARAATNPPIDRSSTRMRDAITNTLMPKAGDAIVDWIHRDRVPYGNR